MELTALYHKIYGLLYISGYTHRLIPEFIHFRTQRKLTPNKPSASTPTFISKRPICDFLLMEFTFCLFSRFKVIHGSRYRSVTFRGPPQLTCKFQVQFVLQFEGSDIRDPLNMRVKVVEVRYGKAQNTRISSFFQQNHVTHTIAHAVCTCERIHGRIKNTYKVSSVVQVRFSHTTDTRGNVSQVLCCCPPQGQQQLPGERLLRVNKTPNLEKLNMFFFLTILLFLLHRVYQRKETKIKGSSTQRCNKSTSRQQQLE